MKTLRAMLVRLSGLFRRKRQEAELAEELRAHLDELTERNLAAGMPADEARAAAQRAFGGVEQIRERARDERRSVWVEQAWQDLRYAARALPRAPSFTIAAVLTLALGIGLNAALFSVYNMLTLQPLPVHEPAGLARIGGRDAHGGGHSSFNHAEYVAYRDHNRTLDGLLAFFEANVAFEPPGGSHDESLRPSRVDIELVSENYFRVLGGPMQLGRPFLPEELTPGATPVVVISDWFWERYFQRDPQVLGATVKLHRQQATVIGVAAAAFSGQGPIPPAAWGPYAMWSREPGFYGPEGPARFRFIGRLRPTVTEAQVAADFGALAVHRAAEFPGPGAKVSVQLDRGMRLLPPLHRSPQGLAFLGLIFFGFGLVLAVACTNVGNLLLARGVSRQAEIGVRLTLGASRGRIVRQLLAENALLCGLGAMLGLGVAASTLRLLYPFALAKLPGGRALETHGMAFFDATPDWRVVGFTALLMLGTTLVSGFVPAWQAAGAHPIAAIRNDGTVFGRRVSPARLRRLLVIAQVAICLTLLSCAGVLARNFFAVSGDDVGFEADAVFYVEVIPNPAIADRPAALRQALDAVRAIPGVAGLAIVNRVPLLPAVARPAVRLAGTGGPGEGIGVSFVTGSVFDTLGLPLRRGRPFREAEQHSTAQVVIVSESLARRLWPGQEAVGRRLAIHEGAWAPPERPAPAEAFRECEVIGVAGDVLLGVGQEDRRFVYLPFALDRAGDAPAFLRPQPATGAALAAIVRAAEGQGVGLELGLRMTVFRDEAVLPFYFMAAVSGVLGALALGLASVGLYGVMAFAVNRRTRELGIRLALGATAEKVVGLLMRDGLRLVGIGLVLGLIGGGLFALLLGKILFGLDTFDAAAFAVVTALFVLIALFACWLPARRAAKVDPMVALRAE